MADKMTNKKALAYVLENVPSLPDDVKKKLESMAAALENKANSATRKPTEKQKENIVLREKILNFLRANPVRLVTCTEIGKEVPELDGMNNQRISALMRTLVESGVVTKITEKGKSLFQLAKEDAGE